MPQCRHKELLDSTDMRNYGAAPMQGSM